MMTTIECNATLEKGLFTLSNSIVSRSWRVDEEGRMTPQSFVDLRSGKEWLAGDDSEIPLLPEGRLSPEKRTVTLQLEPGRASVVEEDSLCAILTATGSTQTLITRFQIFPEGSSISIQHTCQGASLSDKKESDLPNEPPTGIEISGRQAAEEMDSDVIDVLPLKPGHVRFTAVTLRDQTDCNDELVSTEELLLHPSKGNRDFEGILFVLEDTFTGEGLILVKESPLPNACPVSAGPTLSLRGLTCVVKGHGTGGDGLPGYRLTTIAYQGGSNGRTAALQQWQRNLRSYASGRDGVFLTNTWGDRSQDGRITEEFMLSEVKAAADVGADAVQIDDGWQKGTTANSVEGGGVWIGFWKANPEFWHPHPERLPKGLDPLIARAEELNMHFGLWFAPDSADEFASWQKDAECILDFHKRYGIRFIKIDGVKALTKKAERNLRAIFDRVLEESNGEVIFDLDVTAEIRPGYFGMLNMGAVFVENRYTDWGQYWPHRTLRNLWNLGHWVDPVRLRMEFLNSERNLDKYPDDLLAPAKYRPDTLLATVLFASPLGWFEASHLSEKYLQEVAPLAKLRREYRDEWLTGTILPIGECPDGVCWTGFVTVAADKKSITYVVFREMNSEESMAFELPYGLSGVDVVALAGQGSAAVEKEVLYVSVDEKLGYGIFRVTVEE